MSLLSLLLACPAAPIPLHPSDCADDACLQQLVARLLPTNPEEGVAALEAITDPDVRMAVGGTIFANRELVFDRPTSARICAALHASFEEAFCERRLGSGHLRER